MRAIERILDANQNRCVEGLRVLEEYARFIKDDGTLSGEIRALRHYMRKNLSQRWVMYRFSDEDVGKKVSSLSQLDHKSHLKQVLRASTSRVSESLRVLEEYLKISGHYTLSKDIETKRFHFYGIEKRLMSDFLVHGLYALTQEGSKEEILDQVATFIDQGVGWVQYRDKKRSPEEKTEIARDIMALVHSSSSKKTKIIINDEPDIALEVGAHGVHVGQGDMTVKEVRSRYQGLFVGVSTHNTYQLDQAILDEADYIALGPIFETRTKENPEPCAGMDFARYARTATDIPLVAIGGIDATNIHLVKGHGMDAFAMTASISDETKLIQIIKIIGG